MMDLIYQSVVNSLLINIEIIAAYIAALFVYRNKYFYSVAVIVLLVCLSPDVFFENQYYTFDSYIMFSIVFAIASYMLNSCKKYLPSMSLCLISIYCAIFAADTWVNSNAKTWNFINHEYIIVSLYAAILLSFSERLPALVASCFSHISGIYVNIKPNPINNSSRQGRESKAENK
tara:strand:- start:248 stop:772 length:525 start_codon:yes stop_codon:yes gene_type:complete